MNYWRPSFGLSEPKARFNLATIGSLENQDQLSVLQPGIKCLLADKYEASKLIDKLCPVERNDGTVSIFARAEYVGTDQADALEDRIKLSGKQMSQPGRYILPAGLLLSLARGADLKKLTTVKRTPSALAGVFHDLVQWAVRVQATDIHININKYAPVSEVCFTVAGRYIRPDRYQNMPTALLQDVLSVAWMDIQGGNGAVFDPLIEQQGVLNHVIDGKAYILRWASLAADIGASVCLRVLSRDAKQANTDFSDLGYSLTQINTFKRILQSDGGAIIFAGTVGSGKSTSLSALMSLLPKTRKIITVEEPVEYRIPNAVQNSISRDLGLKAGNQYAAKLRTLKRSAMTDVLLGEIRDGDSGLAFMDLAGSGVNVYSTVHAPSAAAIIDRLASEFIGIPTDFLYTNGILKLLVHQALLPVLCDYCSLDIKAHSLSHDIDNSKHYWLKWLSWIGNYWNISAEKLRFRNPVGCKFCISKQVQQLAGYTGRTVVADLLEPISLPGAKKIKLHLPDASKGNPVFRYGAMAHAMEKAALGKLDIRDIETRFVALETIDLTAKRLGLAYE